MVVDILLLKTSGFVLKKSGEALYHKMLLFALSGHGKFYDEKFSKNLQQRRRYVSAARRSIVVNKRTPFFLSKEVVEQRFYVLLPPPLHHC